MTNKPAMPPLLNCRHIFLFDTAVIVCKRRGDNYEMKEVIDLHLFKITNNPTSDKENRKVRKAVFSARFLIFPPRRTRKTLTLMLTLCPPLPRRVT